MHQQNLSDDSSVTDTMRIFQWGLQKGRPAEGQIGAQPEWFYKGDGSIVVRPEQSCLYLHLLKTAAKNLKSQASMLLAKT